MATAIPESFECTRENWLKWMIRPAVRKGHVLPIDARHQIYLWPYSGNGPRFVGLFRATWTRIPLGARRRMLKHWRDDSTIYSQLCQLAPSIEMSEWCPDNPDEDGEGKIWGQAKFNGRKLWFSSIVFDRMPDEIAQDLIAHELAHVLQYSFGWDEEIVDDCHVMRRGDDVMTAGELEQWADEIMQDWGFDDTAMDDWAVKEFGMPTYTLTMKQMFEAWIHFDRTGSRSLPEHIKAKVTLP